jgi:hypothetical protein
VVLLLIKHEIAWKKSWHFPRGRGTSYTERNSSRNVRRIFSFSQMQWTSKIFSQLEIYYKWLVVELVKALARDVRDARELAATPVVKQ